MTALQHTPLDDRHQALGATMTSFGGWQMPLDYGSVVAEHHAVRTDCGVFDLSHLGALRITGDDALAVVQHAFSNDAAALEVGECQYTLCLDDNAGIVDDLILSRFDWGFWAVPNAANAEAVRDLVARSADGRRCEVTDVRPEVACLAVQGPRSAQIVMQAGVDPSGLDFMTGRGVQMATPSGETGGPRRQAPPDGALLTRTGYTGEHGYELVLPVDRAPDMWDKLTAAGAAPVGLGARDTLRLEMGYALHGSDLSQEVTPVEARLGWAVNPGTGFRGEEAYRAAEERGAGRRLWGLRARERGIPRPHQEIRTEDGAVIGEITSGTFSPTAKVGIAMGYVDVAVERGRTVIIDVRGRDLRAEVVRPPFVDADPRA